MRWLRPQSKFNGSHVIWVKQNQCACMGSNLYMHVYRTVPLHHHSEAPTWNLTTVGAQCPLFLSWLLGDRYLTLLNADFFLFDFQQQERNKWLWLSWNQSGFLVLTSATCKYCNENIRVEGTFGCTANREPTCGFSYGLKNAAWA